MTGADLTQQYDVLDLLAHGGTADVHRARERSTGHHVAIKMLRQGSDADLARFTNEGRVLARLSHPGLVPLLAVGVHDGRRSLVMELVSGESLARCNDRRRDPLSPAAIGAGLASVLAHVHAHGIVHRDVKPSNVLIGAYGVKLTDFGIAAEIGDCPLTPGSGQVLGTPAYMAPEQIRGEAVAAASDVYSLGLVLLEALTRERVYPGPPVEAALERLHAPTPVPESLPRCWRDLLTRTNAIDPADRPTADQLADELEGLALSVGGPAG